MSLRSPFQAAALAVALLLSGCSLNPIGEDPGIGSESRSEADVPVIGGQPAATTPGAGDPSVGPGDPLVDPGVVGSDTPMSSGATPPAAMPAAPAGTTPPPVATVTPVAPEPAEPSPEPVDIIAEPEDDAPGATPTPVVDGGAVLLDADAGAPDAGPVELEPAR